MTTARTISLGRVAIGQDKAEIWLAAAALLALTVEPVIGALGALAFLMAGLALMAMRPAATMSDLLRSWPILVLPAVAVLSLAWSQAPSASLRHGLQLLITFAIAVVVARSLPPRTFLALLFAALGLIVLASVTTGHYRSGTGALTGYYASKNAMGGAAAMFAILAGGLALASARSLPTRFGYAMAAGLGLFAVVLAQSMSALLSVTMGFCALLAVAALRPLSPGARTVGALICLLFVAYVSVWVAANIDAVAAYILDRTGKDVTLTGRTVLWDIAVGFIAERPLLGVGYQAFWVPGNPPAEALWHAFGIESRTGFHFHSVYLSNAVEIGLVGLAVQIALLAAIGFRTGRLALSGHDGLSPVLFALSVMVLSITPIEVPVFFQFNLQTVSLIAILIYANDGLRARRA